MEITKCEKKKKNKDKHQKFVKSLSYKGTEGHIGRKVVQKKR